MLTRLQAACEIAALTLVFSGANAQADWPTDGAPLAVFPCSESPTAAVPDDAGGAFVVWTDNRSCSRDEVYVLRVTGAGLPSAGWPASGMPVTTNTAGHSGAIAGADGSGGVIVVWNDSRLAGTRLYASTTSLAGWELDVVAAPRPNQRAGLW